nr:hypothetical protein OG409_00370 [Streptomyces sp. NBC_00974]WSX54290.1 hypothetical protein OG409_38540 [Streptomyces sp. NBC_00974]
MGGAEITEPVEARPWRPEDGPQPRIRTWPGMGRPALYVWSAGSWRLAAVLARQDRADGRVIYQVDVDLNDSLLVVYRAYEWPQPGLRVAYRCPVPHRSLSISKTLALRFALPTYLL